jgi:heat-inducible transcriptional repressor
MTAPPLVALPLNERARALLKALVERYITEGQPVGSRTLARGELDLSPATIRNVMADLEELGLIRAPHTSAGRVPTANGYRVFIDSLLTVKPLEAIEIKQLSLQLATEQSAREILGNAAHLLSGLTQLAAVISLPRRENLTLRHIEFLPLGPRRALAILILSDGEIQNRILQLPQDYSPAFLQQAANYLNSLYAGFELGRMRERLLAELRETRKHVDQLMLEAIEMATQVLQDAPVRDDYLLSGQTNLMSFDDLSDRERLRQLFEAFNQKRQILRLLEQCQVAEGVHIFIGEESGYQILGDCSVVTAPYHLDGQKVGVIGVIGPTRMAYERVIPLVDVTARLLSAGLKNRPTPA